jgi:hypothetical protein
MKRFMLAINLFVVATVAHGAPPQSLAKIEQGITENLQANCIACNEENMEKLLACMSEEMPNQALFIQTTEAAWREIDTYNRVDEVKVLRQSNAPHANCQYPYATALVTQTIIKVDNGQSSALKQCEKGESFDNELARKMNLDPKFETARTQMLFKHEHGQWRLIAGLTDPEPVQPVEKAPGGRTGRSR